LEVEGEISEPLDFVGIQRVTMTRSACFRRGPGKRLLTPGQRRRKNPRSAIQTSPGRGLIEKVQDFLLHFARPNDVEKTLVSQLDDLGDVTSDLFGGFRAPFTEFLVTPLS